MHPLNRREFLAAGAVVAARVACGDVATPRGVLGFSLYGMKGLPLDEACRACAKIGYDAIEWAALPQWPGDPVALGKPRRGELRGLLADLQLGLAGTMENLVLLADEAGHRANLERLARACALSRDLAPETAPLVETILGGSPSQWADVKDRMAARLVEWGEALKQADADAVLTFKPHVAGALHRPEDALWLLKQVDRPNLRLVYDYSHYQLRDYELEPTLTDLIASAPFVHVKDARGDAAKVTFLLPGEGTIDYRRYGELLVKQKYRGPVVVEVSGQIFSRPDYDPVQAAQRSYDHLAAKFRDAGWRTV